MTSGLGAGSAPGGDQEGIPAGHPGDGGEAAPERHRGGLRPLPRRPPGQPRLRRHARPLLEALARDPWPGWTRSAVQRRAGAAGPGAGGCGSQEALDICRRAGDACGHAPPRRDVGPPGGLARAGGGCRSRCRAAAGRAHREDAPPPVVADADLPARVSSVLTEHASTFGRRDPSPGRTVRPLALSLRPRQDVLDRSEQVEPGQRERGHQLVRSGRRFERLDEHGDPGLVQSAVAP